jgi:23S rRNA (guanosine2251-2'-O)-methyltransferase
VDAATSADDMRKLIHAEILERRLTPDEALASARHPVIGVLENVRSLYNVGSCFRTADAMLLERLVLTGYTPAPPRSEIAKTALGATETVPWEHESDVIAAVRRLRDEGVAVYALEITEGSTPIDAVPALRFPAALVVGNEIAGVSQAVLEHCDGALEIPMYGVKHSLNVAVAFGIGVWELVRAYRTRAMPR